MPHAHILLLMSISVHITLYYVLCKTLLSTSTSTLLPQHIHKYNKYMRVCVVVWWAARVYFVCLELKLAEIKYWFFRYMYIHIYYTYAIASLEPFNKTQLFKICVVRVVSLAKKFFNQSLQFFSTTHYSISNECAS